MRIENYGSGSIKSFPTVGVHPKQLQLASREDQTEECSQGRFPRYNELIWHNKTNQTVEPD